MEEEFFDDLERTFDETMGGLRDYDDPVEAMAVLIVALLNVADMNHEAMPSDVLAAVEEIIERDGEGNDEESEDDD
jgi:hypothetical protein